ncbi:MAG: gliding motility-associated protein GldL [Sphingobacteriales bacterium]|jgi:gliding motility-associated protein GldL
MLGSKKFKLLMHKLYGFGASIVILGAMFKILHLPGAGIMLGVGLSVEALIFFFSALEPPHEDPDWSLVYPELAGMESHDVDVPRGGTAGAGPKDGVSQELDRLMEEAKIGPELIESLGSGLRNFGDKVKSISNAVDTSVATDELNGNIKEAASQVGNLGKSYQEAAMAIDDVKGSVGDTKEYTDQLQNLSKNLGSLNAMYELELQDSNNHLKTLNKFYGGISETMENFNSSLEDSKRYKQEVARLADNLSSLNSVYGNMLSAMNQPVK